MITGICIHATIRQADKFTERVERVDIGDPRLSAPTLLRWMATLDPAGMRQLIHAVHELNFVTLLEDGNNERQHRN